MMTKNTLKRSHIQNPANISAFDRAMRGLVKVPKSELEAELQKSHKEKTKPQKAR